MNEGHGITRENLMRIFPKALTGDKSLYTLADAAAQLFVKRREETDIPRVLPEIDRLDEAVLDILAYDMKVDWYNYDYPIKTKRELIKNSVLVHKQMGTVYAVKSVLKSLYPDFDLEEWFSYDGTPGCFRLNFNISSGETAASGGYTVQEIVQRIAPVKRLSAHLDSVSYTFRMPPSVLHIGGVVGSDMQFRLPQKEDVFDFQQHLHVGGTGAVRIETNVPEMKDYLPFSDALYLGGTNGASLSEGVPEKPDNPQFTESIQVGGTGSIRSGVGIPEDTAPPSKLHAIRTGGTSGIHSGMVLPENTAPPPSFSITRTGGVCTIISNISGKD